MKKRLTIMIWLSLATLLTYPANHFFFQTVDVKDGLADNFVRDITRDSYGYIWVSTINGVSRYDGYRLVNYLPQQAGTIANDVLAVRETADSTLWMVCQGALLTYQRTVNTWQNDGAERLARLGIDSQVKVFYVDEKGEVWATTEDGLYHYDYSAKKLSLFKLYSPSPITQIISKDETTLCITADYKIYKVGEKEKKLIFLTQAPSLNDSRDNHVFLDGRANLWLYQSHAIAGTQWVFTLKDRKWQQMEELKQMGNVTINAITEDHNGNIWIGTGNRGVGVFSPSNNTLLAGTPETIHPFTPHSSHISCFFLDKNNTLWIGSAKLGFAFADLSSPEFQLNTTDSYEDISALTTDQSGNLWIGFDGGGIMKKNQAGVVTHFSSAGRQLPSDIITSLAIHSDGSLLAGTYGYGIVRYDGAQFTPFCSNYTELRYVKAMTSDLDGNLWIATVDKGVAMLTPEGRLTIFTSNNSQLPSNGTLCLACDSLRNRIYIGTSAGIAIYDGQTRKFIQNKSSEQLKSSYINSLLVCNRQWVWIGSRDGLWVYIPNNDSISHLTTDQGLSHNVVRALAKSKNSVWASTDNGLTCITVGQHGYECRPFFDNNGLHNVIFSNNAAWTNRNGTILLGSFSGYVSFSPDRISVNRPKLHVAFTEFRINGQTEAKDPAGFTIRHNERLGISLSVMVPALSHNVKYLYRFKGEKEWSRAPSNMLYFATLMPGTHVLQVKALLGSPTTQKDNQKDIQRCDISELTIRVQPPIWLSNWAIVCYLLLLAVIIYLIYRMIKRQQERKLAIKQMEINLKKYEMEEEKISFFTNISHDIKTPLTMVIAPLEKIKESSLPSYIRTELDVAWQNARQLYDLVVELLDFRRLDVGKEKLNLGHGDLVTFVRQTVQGFSYYAARKKIKMELRLPSAPIETLFDENKMRRIITNLLSNACKYNIEHGTITVAMNYNEKEGQDGEMSISVADTGIGIRDKTRIFDRFAQESHGQEQEGNGLGLYIVKQYVDMMEGTIHVDDNEPRGSIFTVTLPLRKTKHDELTTEVKIGEEVNESTTETPQSKPTILIVEDSTDARLFLQRSLENEYHVLTAANGKEALHQLSKNNDTSIIVSDVMMPVMDGMELVKYIKKDIKYSHIPVILLTAKNSEENIVAGLEEGVADYITKPFSLAVLRLRIRKIVEWTQHVHQQIATGIRIKPSDITVSSLDEEFIGQVIADIEAHIRDSDYSVTQLSSAVSMTRGNLYKKLMAIVGKSPVEFIRIIRLERAKALLDQGRTNISEVADTVGISPKLFAHYYKKMYGCTPSEYLKIKK